MASRTLISFSIATIVLAGTAGAGVLELDPFPQDRGLYTIDFSRAFYASEKAEAEERAAIRALLETLRSHVGHLADSAADLSQTIEGWEDLLVRANRYGAYLHLRFAVNTGDFAARDAERALWAETDAEEQAVRRELSGISPETLDRFVAERPSLAPYRYFVESTRVANPATPTCDDQSLARIQPMIDGWQNDLRDLALDGVPPRTNDAPDPEERRAAFEAHYEALRARRTVVAFALTHLVAARNEEARMHGFPDAPTEAYADSEWTKDDVVRLLEGVAAHADLFERYERLRASHIGVNLGFATVHPWDLHAVPAGSPDPRFTIDQARAAMLDALRPLGPRYLEDLSALLDPQQRRLDIVPGPHRRHGGFSLGFPGTTSMFFAGGFTGRYNDLRILTHESTHAVQRQLELEQGVRPVYADGPHYLFEAVAIFNELLLPDTLAQKAATPQLRQFYLERFLDGKGIAVIFDAAGEAALEQSVYDRVPKGTVRTADDLDALTREVESRYSIWPERAPELKADWMDIPLMIEDPFYDVNYVWAGVIALKLFSNYEHDPARFATQYTAFLENGCDRPAADLLQHFFGIDLHDPQLLDDALAVAAQRIDELESSYRSTDPRMPLRTGKPSQQTD